MRRPLHRTFPPFTARPLLYSQPPPAMRRLHLAALLIGLAAGCFRERAVPPAFRFECERDDECRTLTDDNGDPLLDADGQPIAERCISGLCQFACDGSILDLFAGSSGMGGGASSCPSDKDGYYCFGGTCNHLCDAADDPPTCSPPHKCLEFGSFDTFAMYAELLADSLPLERPGICGLRCDDAGAPDCPEGQLCIDGVCLPLGGGTTGGDTTGGTTGP